MASSTVRCRIRLPHNMCSDKCVAVQIEDRHIHSISICRHNNAAAAAGRSVASAVDAHVVEANHTHVFWAGNSLRCFPSPTRALPQPGLVEKNLSRCPRRPKLQHLSARRARLPQDCAQGDPSYSSGLCRNALIFGYRVFWAYPSCRDCQHAIG